MSSGIKAEELKAINSIIAYRIPPSLDEKDLVSHPIALRYDYLNREKCLLSSIQSCGTDDNGRPGNFFAHTILTSPDDFAEYPPIFYWKHPFWKREDSSSRLEIPVEPFSLSRPSYIKENDIWSFIGQGKREEWFYRLLSAVVQFGQLKRPIIILDTNENIALWIVAITFALPNNYRSLLSFATYHQDPYQAPFIITGTTADSRFRFSPDEYISYTVLNANNGQISNVPDSLYASYVRENFTPELFEAKLLDLFELCNAYPKPNLQTMSGVFDAFTKQIEYVRERRKPITDNDVQQTIGNFFDSLGGKESIEQVDLDDLTASLNMIEKGIIDFPTAEILALYQKGLRLYKRFSTDYTTHAVIGVSLLIAMILKDKGDFSRTISSTLKDIYDNDVLVGAINRSESLTGFLSRLENATLSMITNLWMNFVPLMRFDTRSKTYLTPLLKLTFDGLSRSSSDPTQDRPSPEIETALRVIVSATSQEQGFLINNGLAWKTANSQKLVFEWLYYEMVKDLSLEGRMPYRRQVITAIPTIIGYEMRRDIYRCAPTNIIRSLEEWLRQTNDTIQRTTLLEEGLTVAWSQPQNPKQSLAQSVLGHPTLSGYLSEKNLNKLIPGYFTGISLKRLSSEETPLYEKYCEHPHLNLEQQAMIGGSLAMTIGRFTSKSIETSYNWLSRLSPQGYEVEAGKLISRFFEKGVTPEAHADMLRSVYTVNHDSIFWDLYWDNLGKLFLKEDRANDILNILNFWFEESFTSLQDRQYLAASFFITLSPVLLEIVDQKGTKKTLENLDRLARDRRWYAILRPILFPPKERILGIFQRQKH
jgi:hypothetical protein